MWHTNIQKYQEKRNCFLPNMAWFSHTPVLRHTGISACSLSRYLWSTFVPGMCQVLGEMQRQKGLRSWESPGKGVETDRKCMCAVKETCIGTGSGNYGLWSWPCLRLLRWLQTSLALLWCHLSNKGLEQMNAKLAQGAECYHCCEPGLNDCASSQNGTHPTIPSHWLYLHCAFLINSGGAISVFPA